LFSIGTIAIPTHIEPISKIVYIPDICILKPILKQHVEPICVSVINLTLPPNIVKQHPLEMFFHPKVGEMIINETTYSNLNIRSNHS
jgi:hypothetical protein